MVNLIATLPGRRTDRILFTGHYDTNLFKDIVFLGASDGASSAAVLLELARVLKDRPREFTYEFVWFDGEEAMVEWDLDTDSTYGSRYDVQAAQKAGAVASIKAMILVDMVGHRDLQIERDIYSTPWLTDIIWAAAKRLGHARIFRDVTTTVEDDHVHFVRAGVPSVDIIDLIDPGAHVDDRVETANLDTLRELAALLPNHIQPRASGLSGGSFDIEGLQVHFDEFTLTKAAVKYGRAIEHVSSMYHHLASAAGEHPFELGVSVDETEQPTSHAEHIYIASELKRLGVRWVSLAPRYVGSFEKGVDYIGSTSTFERDFAGHAAIARHFGPYKLSLHSGSDKFSIYPVAARLTHGLVHLKTAGTSYLEALKLKQHAPAQRIETVRGVGFALRHAAAGALSVDDS